MRICLISLLVITMLQFGVNGVVLAQDEGCVTGKCHQTVGKAEWVHGPVGVGACTVCHNRVEGKDHEFHFSVEKQELCFACHDDIRDMMMKNNRHTPVAQGNCTGCHDPHQSNFRFTLKRETKELCFACHEKTRFEGSHVHEPVGQGDCVACHDPHASDHSNQLVAEPGEICFQCHSERTDIRELRHSHPPVEESCRNCHAPHASKQEFLLEKNTPELCYSCHKDIAEHATVTNQHEPVQAGRCQECHNVHGSEQPKLMPARMTEVCYRCHEELGDYVKAQEFRHGPVKDDDCIACHDPHGSDFNRILRKYFPEEFYVAYAEENYAMCFECHNEQIALDAETETLTDFRNGKQNLHNLHVNKIEKGRSCKACHDVHASSQKKHVRRSVPYGTMKWELPVKYAKSDNGGSCQVGCHSPKDYKRK